MKHRSFRLRIALLSTALAGGALVGFSGVAWRLIYRAKVSQLDVRLENQIRRLARPLPPDVSPDDEISFLNRILAANTDTEIALQVRDTAGQLIYQSTDWKADFNQPDLFPPRLEEPSSSRDPSRESEPFPRRNRPGRSENPTRLREPRTPPRLITQQTATGSWRIVAGTFTNSQVAIAVNLNTLDREMAAIRNIFLIAIPGTLLLVAAGAWWLSSSALHPIQRVTGAMQQVTVAGLDQRVPIGTTDVEFVELIQVFNQMLERLERSFKQASRFSGDAAHELKTPLAILQGELEQAIQQAEPGSGLQQTLGSLLDEVRHLSSIIRKLLLLSLADAGQMGLHKVPLDLAELLAVMVEDLELLAPALKVQTDITPPLSVLGDRDLLTQVLQNLMSNAIKYNLPNGWIQIQASQQSQTVQVTLTNASKEIPVRDRSLIFDRFYRGDPARTRTVEGIGLGLSLAREVVHAHQGTLTLDETLPGQTSFTLTLPSSSRQIADF
ncbi:MAG: ATP-binding protein [Cyanobacteria bacterium J06638_28]